VFRLSFQLLTSQPITDIISNATNYLNIDTENWTLATARGIWTRTASEWIIRAQTAGVEWGTKQGIQARKSEITARINTISGDKYSCRPLELVDSSPFPLPLVPTQVFIITTASEIVATTNGKVEGYVHGPLSLKLKLSERLVRACISSSFCLTASVLPAPNHIQIRQFLMPPLSLLPLVAFDIHRSHYGNVWPDQSTRIIQHCRQLQAILLNGNNQINTLILLAHQAYNHLGWIQWAKQMSGMSPDSSFGIGYVCVPVSISNILTYSFLSADRDIVFERDRTLYGRHGLDYIIAIPNRSLQVLSAYLSTRTSPK
jgi:hypothetical protein